jgi:hypothetical protein
MSAPSYSTRADANRANSQHSTGPRTEAGKSAVSTKARNRDRDLGSLSPE